MQQRQTHQEDLLKHELLEPIPRVSDAVGLGLGAIICISSKFPDDDAAMEAHALPDLAAQPLR